MSARANTCAKSARLGWPYPARKEPHDEFS
jgi:hypothetical protein